MLIDKLNIILNSNDEFSPKYIICSLGIFLYLILRERLREYIYFICLETHQKACFQTIQSSKLINYSLTITDTPSGITVTL